MRQLINDCFSCGKPLITVSEALKMLKERLRPIVDSELVSLSNSVGRILAENIVAPNPVPRFDNAAVDGYAFRHKDLNPKKSTKLKVIGRVTAGHPTKNLTNAGETWRIFTGAPIPFGLDTVIMQEDCVQIGNDISVPPGVSSGINRRKAGEDLNKGDIFLHKGQKLQAAHIGQAASISRKQLKMFKQLRIALFSSGDEILDVGENPREGCIFDSNRYSINALLLSLGCKVEDLGILPDKLQDIEEALYNAAEQYDVIITSAGVSSGDEDHIREAAASLGSLYFWRIAIRPGRPLALGQIEKTPFIGLPGNPAAGIITFLQIARPALLLLSGAKNTQPLCFQVPAHFSYRKKAGLREWIGVSLKINKQGISEAHKFSKNGAGILSSLVASDGLIDLPENLTKIEPGMMVNFTPFSEIT